MKSKKKKGNKQQVKPQRKRLDLWLPEVEEKGELDENGQKVQTSIIRSAGTGDECRMDLERLMLSETSQTVKDKYCIMTMVNPAVWYVWILLIV